MKQKALDTIVYRKGGKTLAGVLQHKSFSVNTDVGKITIPKKKIAYILVDVAAYGGQDEIFTYSSMYMGDLVEDPISIKLDDTGEIVQVPQKSILAIHIGLS